MQSKADRIQRRVNNLTRYLLAVRRLTTKAEDVSPTNCITDTKLPYSKEIQEQWEDHIQKLVSITEAQIKKDQAKLDALEELLEGYE